MGTQRSKEDAVQKISTSVFVTNFPDQSSVKDLWNACKQYGYVVDVFIPDRRSKAGKRFGFVRFIKVFDVERLVNNLCTVWIGRHRIHANVARLQRASLNNSSNQFSYNGEKRNNISDVRKDKGTKDTSNSYVHVVKGRPPVNEEVSDFVKQNEENESGDENLEGELKGDILRSDEDLEGDNEMNVVPDTLFEEDVETDVEQSNQRNGSVREIGEEVKVSDDMKSDSKKISKEDDTESVCSGHFKKFETPLSGANAFNSFNSSAGLEEVPLRGCSFTWCHKSASKMSKLDRFLISKSLAYSFSILHYWFEVDGFEKLVKETWSKAPVDASNAMLNLMKTLKYLKKKIRAWNNDMSTNSNNSKLMFKPKSSELDSVIDKEDGGSKAKIKWATEGDENSKYYHGIVNKKRNQLSIRGVLADGIRINNPASVKNEFLSHFKNRFEIPQEARLNLNMDFPYKLTSTQQSDLEIKVSKEDTKRAVWNCGVDKTPGPNEFSFGFYRHFWKLIETNVEAAVKYLFQYGSISKGCNSSFIALIPKIPDAKMVKDFRPISLIGSLNKIIAKILANRLVVALGDIVNEVQSDFIADRQILDGPFILNELFQWCKSKKKYSFILRDRWCGWIQGCLQSSWGSIIVNGSPTEEFQFFKSISDSNIDTIIHVLDCFYRASGLRINMSKSKLIGISVDKEKVDQAAGKIGCAILKAPFYYLGSKVGGLMSRIQSWNEIVDTMVARLSKWKMNTLLIGGKKLIWGKWNNVLASKESSLWARVIKSIHGDDGQIGKNSKSGYPSIWRDIVQEMEVFKKEGSDIYSYIHKKIRKWGGVEQSQLADLMTKVEGVSRVTMNDGWVWLLEGSGDFSAASVRKFIDDKRLPEVSSKTRWIEAVPIKVNVHAWNVKLDCLPTRINISRRGMDIDFILCLICGNAVESSRRLFFDFRVAREIFRKIIRWCDGSNTTLRNHITHPHYEVIKAQKNQNPKAGQTSMARDGSVFRYDPDYLREQFAGLVIQRA
uniref:RNA-directed DNA polymerase, eukaryota, reverse transcriptase zinc-binding domain protein n=1 Tax=Tanacetum cinerariifolium TaxID=118510 RepID=A0A6L2N7Z9_TANCI|nr:RNA-directed DNA polymerase, eukaryota, reverse transcriptase zinc-binding domain protein [Tanacetum cinerariifolium]